MALAYDLMEPLRPKVDRLILGFIRTQTFTPKDFLLLEDGVCRLHSQLTRKMIELSLDNHAVQRIVDQMSVALSEGK